MVGRGLSAVDIPLPPSKGYRVPTHFFIRSVLREYYLFSLLAQRKKVVPKKKRRPLPYRSAGQRVSSTLLSFGATQRHGAGLSPYPLPDDVALAPVCCSMLLL